MAKKKRAAAGGSLLLVPCRRGYFDGAGLGADMWLIMLCGAGVAFMA